MPQHNFPSILLARTCYIITSRQNTGEIERVFDWLRPIRICPLEVGCIAAWGKNNPVILSKELALGWEAMATEKAVTFLRIVKED